MYMQSDGYLLVNSIKDVINKFCLLSFSHDLHCPIYNSFLVYCRELAPGTISLTGDRATTVNMIRTIPVKPMEHGNIFTYLIL